jgi:hypothetical protein
MNSILNYETKEINQMYLLLNYGTNNEKLMYLLLKYQLFDIASAYNNINENQKR